MRNAGGLDAARAVYADFQSDARLISEDMALRLTHEAFFLPPRELEREYFNRFDHICHEIRAAAAFGAA
jgi:hypothetical protein